MNPNKIPVISRPILYRTIVQSHELDFYQHVNNAVYLNYMESARVHYLKVCGIDFDTFLKQPAVPVVATAHMDFKKPAFIDDEITIKCFISDRKRVSLTFHYEMYNQHQQLINEAYTVLVFVDQKGKAAPIPEIYLNLLDKDDIE